MALCRNSYRSVPCFKSAGIAYLWSVTYIAALKCVTPGSKAPPIPKTFSSNKQSKKSDLTTQKLQGDKLGVQGDIRTKASHFL
jgi:hypothetical protein